MIDNQGEKITPIQRRVREIIAELGIDVKKFEIESGLSNGFVSKIGNSIRKTSFDKILFAFPTINKNWILTGEGKKFLTIVPNATAKGQSYDPEETSFSHF